MTKKTILIIAAHPDDELLGCAGTVRKFILQGYTAISVILGEGMRSRGKTPSSKIKMLRQHAQKANKMIGIKKVHFENLPDNEFDTVSLLKIVKIVEGYILKYSPDIIFTHFENDLNIDHGLSFRAVLTACRPQPGFKYPDIYSFEIPSSTDFNEVTGHNLFTPNVHVNIEDNIKLKLAALSCYTTEMRDYPHARSIEGIKLMAQYRGVKVGLKYAESFQLIRKIEP